MSAAIDLMITGDLTVDQIASAFASLSDHDQAQVLIEAARIAEGWPDPSDRQWQSVGERLRYSSRSTRGARQLVKAIYEGMAEGGSE